MEIYEQETRLYKALMHPVRLATLDLLREGEECVCHMQAAFGLRQAYISQQLMVLREAGLVQDRRDGLNVYYRVIRPEIFAVMDVVRMVTGKRPAPIQNVNTCSCPNCKEESGHLVNVPFELTSPLQKGQDRFLYRTKFG